MANFKDFNLTVDKSVKVIKVKNQDIAVKQYLPAEDKNAILEIAMQQADQGTILNTFALDSIFHVYLVIKYTDLVFTPEDMEDILALYDLLETNKIIDAVVNAIPENEYNSLREYLIEMVNNYKNYRNSARAILEQLTFFAPDAAEQVQKISENIDIDKVKQIVQLADYTGMNNGQK